MPWQNDDWLQVSDRLRSRWDRLTHDDLAGIAGERHQLVAKLQEIYGFEPARAEAELRDWERHQEPIEPGAPPRFR